MCVAGMSVRPMHEGKDTEAHTAGQTGRDTVPDTDLDGPTSVNTHSSAKSHSQNMSFMGTQTKFA